MFLKVIFGFLGLRFALTPSPEKLREVTAREPSLDPECAVHNALEEEAYEWARSV